MAAANNTAIITTPSSSSTFSFSSTPDISTTPSSISTPIDTPTPTPSSTTPSVALVTSVVTESGSNNGTPQETTVIVTSTAPPTQPTVASTTPSSSKSSSSSTSSSAALSTTTHGASKSGGGLTGGGKVAVAVVVPVAAVALIVLAALWFWRRRKQRKNSEELRKKEIEEYGFNPNNDPTLPPVGSATEGTSEMQDDSGGYRGWGATSTQRQPSTNLSSSNRGIGMAVSDEGSNGGYHQPGSPTQGYSNDPIVGSPTQGGRPLTGDSETIGALGVAPIAAGARQRPDDNVQRGPSNASSAYSAANRSDGSAEAPIPVEDHEQEHELEQGGPHYYEEGPYYDDRGVANHGPYGDGSYGGAHQPVIQNVQARRNTRIEKPSVYPPQGNSGIAQNF